MFLLFFYLSLALGFSFYCSIAESVLLSITPSFIATLKKTKPAVAENLQQLKANIDRPLAAILSLNTIAHTVGAAGVGAQASSLYGSGYMGLASGIMTLLILVFSEIIPKTLGALYWRTLGPLMAGTISWLILLLFPLVWLSELLTRLLAGGKAHPHLTRDELTAMAEIGVQQGVLEDRESRVFRSLLRLPELSANDIMTPRVVMIALPESMAVGEAFRSEPDLPVSRLPVFRDTLDHVTGFVLKNDLLLAQVRDENDRPLSDFIRPITTVNATMPLPKLLEALLAGRSHIVVVNDQYGSTVGLVTLEDVMETLLGLEIVDESDTQVDMQAYARQRWQERAAKVGLQPREH